MGRIVSSTELAKLMDVTPPTVRNWVEKGMPVHEPGGKGKGKGNKFDTGAVFRWWGGGAEPGLGVVANEDMKTEKILKIRVERKIKELELEEKARRLVDISEYITPLRDRMVTLRTRMLAISPSVSPTLASLDDPIKVDKLLEKKIREALMELSNLAFLQEGEPGLD